MLCQLSYGGIAIAVSISALGDAVYCIIPGWICTNRQAVGHFWGGFYKAAHGGHRILLVKGGTGYESTVSSNGTANNVMGRLGEDFNPV